MHFDSEIERLAQDIAGNSRHSLRGYKRLFAQTADLPLAKGLDWEISRSPGNGPDFADRVAGRFRR